MNTADRIRSAQRHLLEFGGRRNGFREHRGVKLMSPQFVIPYRKGNKNDPNDAEAICEAVTRPSMRFVPIKNEEQQDLRALHRVREQLVKNRTALANQIRGLLRERGVVVAQAIARLRAALPVILEDQSNRLSGLMRELLGELAERLRMLDDRLRQYDQRIALLRQAEKNFRCDDLEDGIQLGTGRRKHRLSHWLAGIVC